VRMARHRDGSGLVLRARARAWSVSMT
jgi:hypothetical protein